jgi:hypothetical protein
VMICMPAIGDWQQRRPSAVTCAESMIHTAVTAAAATAVPLPLPQAALLPLLPDAAAAAPAA